MERVIAIGDLHGHYPALETLLVSLQDQYDCFSTLNLKKNKVLYISIG